MVFGGGNTCFYCIINLICLSDDLQTTKSYNIHRIKLVQYILLIFFLDTKTKLFNINCKWIRTHTIRKTIHLAERLFIFSPKFCASFCCLRIASFNTGWLFWSTFNHLPEARNWSYTHRRFMQSNVELKNERSHEGVI